MDCKEKRRIRLEKYAQKARIYLHFYLCADMLFCMAENKPLTAQELGTSAEKKIVDALRKRGFKSIRAPYRSPFDLVVDGARVEVKCARSTSKGRWVVNFHRHGILDESKVDAYIVRLMDVPSSLFPIHLVFKAPTGTLSVGYTFRSLVTDYASSVENWKLLRSICNECKGKTNW